MILQVFLKTAFATRKSVISKVFDEILMKLFDLFFLLLDVILLAAENNVRATLTF